MKLPFGFAFLAISLASGSSLAAEWKKLPASGFVSGRAATLLDVQNGDAIFVAKVGDKIIGIPIPIAIPQYASVRETHDPVIVVQAEEANGLRMFGIRDFDGKESVVTESELDLLGTKKP